MSNSHHVNWLPLGLVLLLAFLSLWLNQLTHRPTVMDNGGFGHDPDYIVEHFDALTFNTTGQPQYRLSAERMTHYMDDDTTVLEQPFLQLQDKTTPTDIRALRAQISGDGQLVHFLNQVHIVRAAPDGKAPITLNTEYLKVAPEQRTMYTNHPVTLRQGASVITASGLNADDRQRLLSLFGEVRGLYE